MKSSEITVTDQFCGAGGSSEGVKQYAERSGLGNGLKVRMALNHWQLAVETHNTNHPDADHDCTDISACDPRRYPSTTMLITSPECTNHSLAKGQKRKYRQQVEMFGKVTVDPSEERSRATMWDVPRFAEYHNYEIIIVENVVDARYWVMFDSWLHAMHSLGYLHECVYLNSMHAHPTPQSRDRMYVVFWKKGNKKPDLAIRPRAFCTKCCKDTESYQSWKSTDKKWGKYRQQYVFRCPSCNTAVEPYYYAAFNCIDWSIPGTRIGDRKKPLSDKTMKRIAYGIEKYWSEPTIITTRYTSGIECRVKSTLRDVMGTQPGDQSHALCVPLMATTGYPPLITSKEYDVRNQRVRDASKEAMFTQSTHANIGVVMPFLIKNYGGFLDPKNATLKHSDPLGTLTCNDHHGIAMPFIVENKGQSKTREGSQPLGCVTTNPYHGVVTPESWRTFLSYYYGGSDMASHIGETMRTVRTGDGAAIVKMGDRPKIEDCYYRMLLPHEVQIGMAFPESYIVLGNSKEKVKQLGNAVTPPAMEFLIERTIETLL